METETYAVAPAKIGNSRGYRVDAAFFQAHPEMQGGNLEATYLGPRTVLLHAPLVGATKGVTTTTTAEADPVVAAYLAWTERMLVAEPGLLRPLSAQEFALAESLVAHVEVDLENDRLPDDFELP
jgi:hypothetical protein